MLRAPSDAEWAVDTDTCTGTGDDRDCNGESGVRFIDIDGIGSICICRRRIVPPRERGERGGGRDQPVEDEAAVHGEDAGRTVDVAVALALRRYGSGARGCPDTPAAVGAPDDDLDVRERTRVDVHDVRALHDR